MTLGQDEAETFELDRNIQSIGSALGGTRSTAWALQVPILSVLNIQDTQWCRIFR